MGIFANDVSASSFIVFDFRMEYVAFSGEKRVFVK
jgi:hypothetical protein